MYNLRMGQEQARELAQRGAAFVMLDVPEHTAIGIDQQMFLVGPNFKGVKMVPPGPHVISYRSGSLDSYGPTTSFFVHPAGGQVLAWKWNPTEEILNSIEDEDEVSRITAGVKSFQLDRNLAPYDLASYSTWQSLTSHITKDVIQAVQPVGGNISLLAEEDLASSGPVTDAERTLNEQLQQREGGGKQSQTVEDQQAHHQNGHFREKKDEEGDIDISTEEASKASTISSVTGTNLSAAEHAGRCTYTPLPRLIKQSGLTPAELTALNLDKSQVLERIIQTKYNNKEQRLIGEFQFAFLAFLLGQSMESFSQWKAFLFLMLGCEDAALHNLAGLFSQFLAAFYAQMSHAHQKQGAPDNIAGGIDSGCFEILSEDIFQDIFLKRLFSNWFAMLREEKASVPVNLAQQAQRVGQLLHDIFGWELKSSGLEIDVSDTDDEDGPVIVEGIDVDNL